MSELEIISIFIDITIFVMAIFLGFELISKVPPTLHTPLMSGANAISGITIVGAMLSAGASNENVLFSLAGIPFSVSTLLGFIAVIFATINVVGGFLVTDRMHRMFKKR
jgi:NAD(P) transhydrogenase subunit alpha